MKIIIGTVLLASSFVASANDYWGGDSEEIDCARLNNYLAFDEEMYEDDYSVGHLNDYLEEVYSDEYLAFDEEMYDELVD